MIDDRMCDHLNHKDACDKCTIERLEERWRESQEWHVKKNVQIEQLKAELDTLRKLCGIYRQALDEINISMSRL